MDSSLLNRAGILLNILAGFLMAPEIIGVDKINTEFKKTEQLVKSIHKIIWQDSQPNLKSKKSQKSTKVSRKASNLFSRLIREKIGSSDLSLYKETYQKTNLILLILILVLSPFILVGGLIFTTLLHYTLIFFASNLPYLPFVEPEENLKIFAFFLVLNTVVYIAFLTFFRYLYKLHLKRVDKDENEIQEELKNKNLYEISRKFSGVLKRRNKMWGGIASLAIMAYCYMSLVCLLILFFLVFLYYISPWSFLMAIAFVLGVVLPVFLYKLVRWYLDSLTGDSGLRFLFVSIGVLCFIIGNILQFLAA